MAARTEMPASAAMPLADCKALVKNQRKGRLGSGSP
jgi:hypothetical protein